MLRECQDIPVSRHLQACLMEQMVTEIEGRQRAATGDGFTCPYCWLDKPHSDEWHADVQRTLMHAILGTEVVSTISTTAWAKRALEQLMKAPKRNAVSESVNAKT